VVKHREGKTNSTGVTAFIPYTREYEDCGVVSRVMVRYVQRISSSRSDHLDLFSSTFFFNPSSMVRFMTSASPFKVGWLIEVTLFWILNPDKNSIVLLYVKSAIFRNYDMW
jgi:hypothetical protein